MLVTRGLRKPRIRASLIPELRRRVRLGRVGRHEGGEIREGVREAARSQMEGRTAPSRKPQHTPDTSPKLGLGWKVPEADRIGRPQGKTRPSVARGGSDRGFQATTDDRVSKS